jgi:RNA polymerase sigma-70 factor (ECF subfamily)
MSFWERILLEQVKRGNARAFAHLCETYREKIYSFIYFRISNREIVEELTNEVFTKILDYLAKGGKIKNFRPFLYQTTRNLIIDFYRGKDKQEISLEEFQEEDFKEEKDLAEQIDTKIDLKRIEGALRQIPDRYREVLVLRFIDGLSFKEIAEITNQNQVNVRQLASRGLKLLRKQLQSQ